MYYLILWDDYCQVVPDCWIQFNEKTYSYPPSKKNITKAVKKKIVPGSDWIVNNYRRIVGPYETYDKAREAEKSCINVSTSDDIQLAALNKPDETLPAKRTITKRKFYDSDTSDGIHNGTNNSKKTMQHFSSSYKTHENRTTSTNNENQSNSVHCTELVTHSQYFQKGTTSITKKKQSDVPQCLTKHPFSIEVLEDEDNDEEREIIDAAACNKGFDNEIENENSTNGVHIYYIVYIYIYINLL